MEESRSTGNKEKRKGTYARDHGGLGYDLLKRKYASGSVDYEVLDMEAVHLGRCPHRIDQTQREGECGLHHVYPHLYGMRTLDGASSDVAGSESRKVTA